MTFLSDLWATLTGSTSPVVTALNGMAEGISDQVGLILPIGIAIMGMLAVPRIVKKIIHTFL
jgi:hypothetical protein